MLGFSDVLFDIVFEIWYNLNIKNISLIKICSSRRWKSNAVKKTINIC